MKLTNNRFYLDHNATSPLATPVSDWLARGDFFFGNPSSIHFSGKTVKRHLNDVTKSLKNTLSITSNEFSLFFHSGATEGINNLIKGHADNLFRKGDKLHFFIAETDHSCLHETAKDLEAYGHYVHKFKVNNNGDFDLESLIESIQELGNVPVLLNYTWANNESGVFWQLEKARKIKEATGCLVHVDGAQAIGKIPYWNKLCNNLDAYTFSGHKFGSLPGAGFSLVKNAYQFSSLIKGGGQQGGMRSGTENYLSIYSLKLALDSISKDFDFEESLKAKSWFENQLISLLKSDGEIVGEKAKCRNGNTIYFILYNHRADIVMTALDLAGIDVSSGSACSSGAIKASHVLKSMGYTDELSKSGIRLSFEHNLRIENAKEYWEKISPILKRFVD